MKFGWLLLLPCIAACGEKSPPPAEVSSGPPRVKALKVGTGTTVTLEDRYSGEVRARSETLLGFRIGGKLVARQVDVGARVRVGQVLARLDAADQQLTLVQAEAQRALAEAELGRTEDLRKRNFVSQAALDVRENAARVARAQARLAQNQSAYTTLTADADGVIAAVLAEPGQVVAAGQGVLRLARDGDREVAIAIPESRITALKVGADATATLWNGRTYRGRLRELAPAADPATRTFAARVALLDADTEVALGMTASVSFATAPAPPGPTAHLVVPLAAILQQGDQPAVWVIGPEGTLSQRPIGIARYTDAGAELKPGPAGGLVAGETIVAAGAFKLVAGARVRIVTP
jgi:membrane fusion protein, multidrug efflux system